MASVCKLKFGCGTQKTASVCSRNAQVGNQEWRLCEGEVSIMTHKKGRQCPREITRVTANMTYVSRQIVEGGTKKERYGA
jgi:hypothetical protein